MNVVDGQRSGTPAADSATGRGLVVDGHRDLVPAFVGPLVVRTDRCPAELDRDDGAPLKGGVTRAEVSTMSDERPRTSRRSGYIQRCAKYISKAFKYKIQQCIYIFKIQYVLTVSVNFRALQKMFNSLFISPLPKTDGERHYDFWSSGRPLSDR